MIRKNNIMFLYLKVFRYFRFFQFRQRYNREVKGRWEGGFREVELGNY